MRHALPTLAFITLVAGAGFSHGLLTDRWSQSEELQRSVARLERVPAVIGDWRGEDTEYDPESMARGGISGCVHRSYTNTTTGATLSVLLVCGRGGPISAHSPEVCYTGIGYKEVRAKQRFAASSTADKFWAAHFAKPDAVVPERLEIYWAWSRTGSDWAAPDSERVAFARFPAVYKLYVVRQSPLAARPDETVVREFMTWLLPELRTALAPSE